MVRILESMRRALLPPLAALLLGAPAFLGAQEPPDAVVRVRITDTARTPLAGVNLVVLRAGEQASYVGTTDDAGRYTFRFVPDTATSYRIVARKLGYLDTRRLLRVRAGDTLQVALALARVPRQLDTVRVDARALSNDYFLDSTTIMRSSRPIFDAYDAARKIHPNMLGDVGRDCDPIAYVWINGRRYPADLTPFMQAVTGHAARDTLRRDASGRPVLGNFPPTRIDPESPLAMIRPQDIATMEYRNCWDTSMPGVGAENALYITLKPGIAFDWKRGSYPADSVPRQ